MVILSPGLSQSISIARLLRQYRPEIRLIAGISGEVFAPASKLYDETIRIDLDQLASFEELVIVPTGALSTRSFCRLEGSFQIGEVEFTADNMRVGNKNWMLDFAKEQSVPIPKTWERFDLVPENVQPVFYKPKEEAGGSLRRKAHRKSGIPEIARGVGYLFQEYIDTTGTYGYGFIARNGDILCSQQHFEKRSCPKDGGSASVIEIFDDKRISEYSKRLIKKLGYSGWGLVEFKYCSRRKDYVFMEINAKFWASLEFALRQQPGFAKLLFDIEMPKTNQQGLVWPARLLASGPISFVMSLNDLRRQSWVFEPGDLRRVAAEWTPESLKEQIKSLLLR